MRVYPSRLVPAAVLLFLIGSGCSPRPRPTTLEEANRELELETRLTGAAFSIVQSEPEAVMESYEALTGSAVIPEMWPLEFAGTSVEMPGIDPSTAIGIAGKSGRSMVVYPFPDVSMPEYGKIVPLAVAQYTIPEPEVQLVLLLICFQSDPEGSINGLSVRSVDTSGIETSAPFALATGPEELRGKFFYDEFLAGSEQQAVAANPGWDRGFMLLTRFTSDVILSTFLPWY